MDRCVFCNAIEVKGRDIKLVPFRDEMVSDDAVACEDIASCEKRMADEFYVTNHVPSYHGLY